MFESPPTFSALRTDLFDPPTQDRLTAKTPSVHPPRFLMLYGSLRERSFSRLLTFEGARLLEAMGGEVKVFNPTGLPLPDGAPDTHPGCRNCASSPSGPKAWSGARPSGMVR